MTQENKRTTQRTALQLQLLEHTGKKKKDTERHSATPGILGQDNCIFCSLLRRHDKNRRALTTTDSNEKKNKPAWWINRNKYMYTMCSKQNGVSMFTMIKKKKAGFALYSSVNAHNSVQQ